MHQHVLKMRLIDEIQATRRLTPRSIYCLIDRRNIQFWREASPLGRYLDSIPWTEKDADSAYFDFYMPSYNKAYFDSCGYDGDNTDSRQIARPPYYWDEEMGKWCSSGPMMHAPTDSEQVYDMNSDFLDDSICDSDSYEGVVDFETKTMDNTQAMKLIGYLHADNEKMRRLLEGFEKYFSAFYAVKNDDIDPYDLLDEWDEMKHEPI